MRIRCSKGLKITAHHGNFFIRSTDLLAIPNTDEEKSFAFQVSLTENLTNAKYHFFIFIFFMLYFLLKNVHILTIEDTVPSNLLYCILTHQEKDVLEFRQSVFQLQIIYQICLDTLTVVLLQT